MPSAAIAFAAYKRSGFPEAVALNCLSERSPTKPGVIDALIARAGLEAFQQVGQAPIRGLFAKAGLLGNCALIVDDAGAHLVSPSGVVTPLTGTIDGDGLVEIDGGLDPDYNSLIRIANGSALYQFVWSPTIGPGSIVQEDFPSSGGAGATSVAFWGGYWVATEAGSDATYRQVPASSTWDPLEFASAEYAPDPLKGLRVLGDQAALLGSASTEMWYLTGSGSDPMAPVAGLKFDIGCRNIAAAVNCKGVLIWVTNDCAVVLSEGGAPQTISDNGLSEQIRKTAEADLSASFFIQDQHPCYVLHLGTAATWVYDLSMKRWSPFSSLNRDYWRPRLLASLGDVTIASDRDSNQVWRLDPDRGMDEDELVHKEFYAFIDVPEGIAPLANVVLDAHLGDAPTHDPDDETIVVLEISRDEGASWSSPRERGLGVLGARTVRPRWNALGQVRAPGAILKFTTAGAGRFRASAVRVNVAA